jgi:WD40 repeat protein
MTAPEGTALEDLPLDVLQEIDRRCENFEASWRAGQVPSVEEYLAGVPAVGRRPLLKELLGLELVYRRKRGEAPARADFVGRFPDDADLADAAWQETEKTLGAAGSAASTDREAAPAPWPAVPGYEVLSELGRGGMGVVYLARHLRLNRRVALKMIAGGLHADPGQRARFQSEAQALARLQHPNIVQIFEVGDSDGRPFLALEFADGGSLAPRLDGTPFPPREAAQLVETLARAVHAAHQAGIIHRDLKPANILLAFSRDPQGSGCPALPCGSRLNEAVPKITDFGLARQVEGDDRQTQTGVLMGSPRYMAPEQAAGAGDRIGPATDVHALGVLLYELLTGRPPFQAATVLDTLEQVRSHEPIAPGRLQPRLPRDLETVCLKCLEKEPARRYASALALADDLRRFRAGEPVHARPVGLLGRARRWCRRNPALAAAGATAALALAATVIVSVVFGIYESRHARDLGLLLRQSELNRTQAERRLAENYLDRAVGMCEGGDLAGGMLWLARSLETAPPEAADLARVIRTNLDGWGGRLSTLKAVLVFHDAVSTTAFSPDGKLLLTTTQGGTARLWDVASGRPIGAPFVHQGPARAAFSPDSKWGLTVDGGQGRLWDAATAEPAGAPLAHPGGVLATAFSPDGRLILTAGADRSARVWSADTGKPAREPVYHPAPISAVAFSPGGQAALIWGGTAAQLWKTAGPELTARALPHQGLVRAAAFSPDGRLLVTGSADGTARCWDVAGGEPLGEPLRHEGPVTLVAFSPDGKVFLTGCGHPWTGCRLWSAGSRKALGPPLTHPRGIRAVAFSPDNKFLITGGQDHTARLWDLATAEQRGPSLSHHNSVHAVAVSPDGARVLVGDIDGFARIWQSAGGKLDATVVEVGNVYDLGFSPGGAAFFISGRDKVIRLYESPRTAGPGPTLPHGSEVAGLTFSPDGGRLVTRSGTATAKGEIRLWDVPGGRPLTGPLTHPLGLRAVAFSPDGRLVASASGGEGLDAQGRRQSKGEVRLWDPSSGQAVGRVMEHATMVRAVAFSPDGRTLAAGCSDHLVRRWDVASGELTGTPFPHAESVSAVAWGPDGQTIVTGCSDYCARTWDVATEEPRGYALCHLGAFNAVAVGPVSQIILTASDDGTARLWDAISGQALGPPLRHQGWVLGVAFSPDGRTAWTGSQDASARLWDVATGKPLGPPLPHEGNVYAGCFKADGQALLTANRDGSKTNVHVHTWRIPRPLDGDLERIGLWTQVITGMELDAAGAVHNLDPDTWDQRRQRLQALGGPPVAARR